MLKPAQDLVKEVEASIKSSTNKDIGAYGKLSMLSAEVGELADEVIALEGDRVEDKSYQTKDDLAKEVVDVIFNALTIANHYGIDMDEYFENRIAKIKSKF